MLLSDPERPTPRPTDNVTILAVIAVIIATRGIIRNALMVWKPLKIVTLI